MSQPDCFKCRHFVITWEQARPYSCRAMGFKSARMPNLVVAQASGSPCLMFEPKPPRPGRDPNPPLAVA